MRHDPIAIDMAKSDQLLQAIWIAIEEYASLLAEAAGHPRPTPADQLAAAEHVRDYVTDLARIRAARVTYLGERVTSRRPSLTAEPRVPHDST